MSTKAWGGRFDEEPSELAARFGASVDVDSRLAPEDIRGSIAHARMLAARGIIPTEDAEKIVAGLEQIAAEVAAGTFTWSAAREDVHMNVEATLTERIGEAGARLHTARSRNDQVATDMRLWTRSACAATGARIDRLIAVLTARAADTVDVLMPGYTHLQRAQPVRLAHHLLAWCEMLERDRGRLDDAARRMNESPLGSGALAATTFPIDRAHTAAALGFARPARNSLDATGDRDFLVEAVSALAMTAVHLSRIGEELVLWSTQEFGFAQMSDAFTTGSSMMPQKKNPDMAELVRGKAGRVVGDLVTLLVLLKGLPLAYNRDLQEDKPPEGFVDATEIADYLAARGVPFREAHHVSGRLVRRALGLGRTLSELSLDELRAEHPAFEQDIFHALEPEVIVERRDVPGGPARRQVLDAIDAQRARLAERGTDVAAVAAELGIGASRTGYAG
jgi:argininosuccinate lyase